MRKRKDIWQPSQGNEFRMNKPLKGSQFLFGKTDNTLEEIYCIKKY